MKFTKKKRIKVRSAEIVVHGTLDKPYYEIKYQTTDGECHIGYSSRKLEHVFWWLDNCFEIISYEQEIRNKAIEEFAESIKATLPIAVHRDCSEIDYEVNYALYSLRSRIDRIAEKMKEVKK